MSNGDNLVCLPADQFKELLKEAAQKGAEEALKAVGLGDKDAGPDIRDIRGILKSFREAKQTAFRQVIKNITNMFFVAFLVFSFLKGAPYIQSILKYLG